VPHVLRPGGCLERCRHSRPQGRARGYSRVQPALPGGFRAMGGRQAAQLAHHHRPALARPVPEPAAAELGRPARVAALTPPRYRMVPGGEFQPETHPMQIRKDFIDSIGNTPLIRLRRAPEMTGCEIYGKPEFMNPGGSVKDRAALYIVQDAIKRGALRPGGTIVEGTAGNTGIGLALVGNALGFRTVIVMPDTQSQEKKDFLRLCGADLRLVPAVPYKDPNNYVKYSGRLAEELAKTEPNGAIWANQFDNIANREAHYRTTGPEIWEQTDGKVDGFTCAVGSGGTFAGVLMALKERNPKVRVALADPMGAALYHYYKHGELKAEGSSITEGIGQGRITANLDGITPMTPSRFPTRKPCLSSSTCCSMRASCLAARPASTSPRRSGWPGRWGRAIPS